MLELNTDFSTKGLSAQELTAIVAAWQHGALSRDSMLALFRRGEILPDGRTNEDEKRLVGRVVLPQSLPPAPAEDKVNLSFARPIVTRRRRRRGLLQKRS